MSNVVEDAVKGAASTPKQIASWAKARPWMFGVLILAVIIITVRYGQKIAGFLAGLPIVGPVLAKLMGLGAAVFLVLALSAHDAAAAGGAIHGASILGWCIGGGALAALFLLRYVAGHAGPAGSFSTFFPQQDVLDLRTPDGAYSVSLTPGTSDQPAQFKVAGDKGSFGGGWMKATGFNWCVTTTFDQAASGGSAVFADELPRIVSGVEILHPLWGTMLTKETGAGPILKNIIEFIGNGYSFAGDFARAVIPSSDGDTTCDLYLNYPLVDECMVRPHDGACWIGWLDQTLLNFNLAPSTAIAAVSTGAVIKAPTSVRCWLDYVLDNDLDVPTLAYWQRYVMNAGNETIRALGLGSAGPKNTKPVERLLGVYELFNKLGLGGTTTADNITGVFVEQLGISRVTNVDAIVRNFLRNMAVVRAPKGGNGASALHSGAGLPYTMGATPSNRLNDSNLAYLALRSPGRMQEITKVPKFAGDLTWTQTYTTTPSSGQHVIVVQSRREFTAEHRRDLMARAGRGANGVDVPLANGEPTGRVFGKGGRRSLSGGQGLPRRVIG